MRLKQLLATILLVIATSAMATASDSQLSGVLVNSRDNAGVVTILANGTFTHTEYRPTDNLMLVDLAGVSVAKQDTSFHAVSAPGVLSYRVAEFRSTDGAQATRIEVNLMPGAIVTVADIQGGVELHVSGGKTVRAAEPKSRAAVSHISGVHVVQGSDGLEIEIAGSAPLTAKTMKLNRPDRLVVDIPNSLLQGRPREIAVPGGGDVKMVRAARFQADPPATRVVLDLASMHDFDVVPSGNKLVVKLHSATVSAAPAAVAAKTVPASNAGQVPVSTATAKAENTPQKPAAQASDMVIVSPTFTSKAAEPSAMESEEKTVEATASRAELAAAHFTPTGPTVARENQPPYAASASLAAKPAAINAALAAQQQQPAAISSAPTSSCVTGRYTGEPIGLNFKDLDLKDFFRVIQEISGLNVVLDPAVKGSVSIFLNDVPWDQALAIVLTNNGLDCQLQGNVLRIATLQTLKTEAEERRAQQEAQALAVPKQTITRYLSYGHAKDAATIIKKFLSARGDVIADDRSNALIIEDIPSTLPKIDELVRMLDRKTPEVEIEARVVASTRTFARDIGTQLGFGFGSGNNAVGGATADSPIKVTPVAPAGGGTPPQPSFIQGTTPGTIPLFSNLPATGPTSGIEFINNTLGFRLDFILTMAETRGLLKILSRPHITTFNNIKALIRQGTRIPVVTQAQLGGPPTVTYVDAFLRLTVTPQITAENTIFLDVDVENTVPDFTRVTGAQLNPTLNTQQATTQVLVTDGGTVVIGGVIQTQNNLAIGQVPVLGSIPLLGNLFKHTSINTQTQELLFFITPKIIQT